MSLFMQSTDNSKINSMTEKVKTKEENTFSASFVEGLCLCQVCYMKFNETTKMARSLHCGHTFCTECIESVQKYGNSAYTECPTCRTETKCEILEMAPNYMVMEYVQKFGYLGPPVPSKVIQQKKSNRISQREHVINEMIDESYRQLIAKVKTELMNKFDTLRHDARGATIYALNRELEELSENVEQAVRGAYQGYSESEGDIESDDSDDESNSIELTRNDESHMSVDNPVNPNRSDISFESDEDTNESTSTDSSSDDASSSSGSVSSSSSYTSGDST